jgi:hypothetical protein
MNEKSQRSIFWSGWLKPDLYQINSETLVSETFRDIWKHSFKHIFGCLSGKCHCSN